MDLNEEDIKLLTKRVRNELIESFDNAEDATAWIESQKKIAEEEKTSYRGPGKYRYLDRKSEITVLGLAVVEGTIDNPSDSYVILSRDESYKPQANYTAVALYAFNKQDDKGRHFTYVRPLEGESPESVSANGKEPYFEPPRGVVVGAVWTKKPREGRPTGFATIAEINEKVGAVRFDGPEGVKQRRWFSYTTKSLRDNWVFDSLPNEIPNATAWTFEQLEGGNGYTRKQLIEKGERLFYNGGRLKASNISSAVSQLSQLGYATVEDGGVVRITHKGARELRQRGLIVEMLQRHGASTIPKLQERLLDDWAFESDAESISRSLSSLEASRRVKRDGAVWATA